MFEIGRVCVKVAGRDGNKPCIVIGKPEGKMVLVDGHTRRRMCSISHLEPTKQVVKLKEGADTQAVLKALEDLGYKTPKRGEPRKTGPRPVKQKGQSEKAAEAPKAAAKKADTPKKATKKATTKKVADKKE